MIRILLVDDHPVVRLGLRALFEGLCDPFHNELPRSLRNNTPRLSFEGENLDNELLEKNLDKIIHYASLLIAEKQGESNV